MVSPGRYPEMPALVRKRAREIHMHIDVKSMYPDPVVSTMKSKTCVCCGIRISPRYHAKYAPGHHMRAKWKAAFEQALREYFNGELDGVIRAIPK